MSEETILIENEVITPETVSAPEAAPNSEAIPETASDTPPESSSGTLDSKIEILDETEMFEEASEPRKEQTDTSAPQTENTANTNTAAKEPVSGSSHHFFRSRREEAFSRDQLILSRISDEDLMEYLRLEEKRTTLLQEAKESRNRRILTAFTTTVILTAIIAIVYLLKDNPAILVNILYIAGLLTGFWFWKKK